ncbi:hypothetical protein D3C87_212390 [compost metagenome]
MKIFLKSVTIIATIIGIPLVYMAIGIMVYSIFKISIPLTESISFLKIGAIAFTISTLVLYVISPQYKWVKKIRLTFLISIITIVFRTTYVILNK